MAKQTYTIVILIVWAVVATIAVLVNYYKRARCCQHQQNFDAAMNAAIKDKTLYPLMDPKFNIWQICKESTLLEKHIADPRQRCNDCICKHFLTISGLADEALTLDKEQQFTEVLKELSPNYYALYHEYKRGRDSEPALGSVLQRLRKTRKSLMPYV